MSEDGDFWLLDNLMDKICSLNHLGVKSCEALKRDCTSSHTLFVHSIVLCLSEAKIHIESY